MFARLSLRLRILLFFGLLGLGGTALAGGALWFGWSRAAETGAAAAFITAFLIFAFIFIAFVAGIWLLFDENVAKPINRLAAEMRLRAHSDVERAVDADAARYLGDLGPAAQALSSKLASSVMDMAAQVARASGRHRAEADRLRSILTEIPLATILVNQAEEIVLYDGQATALLTGVAPPRLKAPLSQYFCPKGIADIRARLAEDGAEFVATLSDRPGDRAFDVNVKPLGDGGFMLILDVEQSRLSPDAARPLVFDFDLLDRRGPTDDRDARLSECCFVAFDTETTGLSTETDDVVQVGAVRVLNGRIVEGEHMDVYVDPKRPIPPASTRIHGVSDADVAGAPDISDASRALHRLAEGAVLVAHNATFDLAFLRRAEASAGVRWSNPVLDTVLLSAIVFGVTEKHSLDDLCDRLSIIIPPELRHTAHGDALATAEALIRLVPLLEALGMKTLGDVMNASRRFRRLQKDANAETG